MFGKDRKSAGGQEPPFGKQIFRGSSCEIYLLGSLLFGLLETVARVWKFFVLNSIIHSKTKAQSVLQWVLLITLGILSPIFGWLCGWLNGRLGVALRKNVSLYLSSRLLHSNSTNDDASSTQRLLSILTNDIYKFESLGMYGVFLLLKPIEIVCWIVVIVRNHGYLLGAFAIFPVFLFLAKFFAMRKGTRLMRRRLAEGRDALVTRFDEFLNGFFIIKAHNWGGCFAKWLLERRDTYRHCLQRVIFYNCLPMHNMLVYASQVILISLAIKSIVDGSLNTKNLIDWIIAITQIGNCLSGKFVKGLEAMEDVRIARRRIIEFVCTSIGDNQRNLALGNNLSEESLIERTNQSSVEYSQVFNQIHKTFCVVTGPSGCGKTMFLNAFVRHLHETSVKIAISMENEWLMETSVKENILLGEPLDDQKLQAVLSCCGLLDEVMALPGSLDCNVGYNGANISGGQRHRLSLARALYHTERYDVFIFDRFLHGIDRALSVAIMEDMVKILHGKTVLIVCDKPEIARYCNTELKINEMGIEALEINRNNSSGEMNSVCSMDAVDQNQTKNDIDDITSKEQDIYTDKKPDVPASKAIRAVNYYFIKKIFSSPKLFVVVVTLSILSILPEYLKMCQIRCFSNWNTRSMPAYSGLFFGIYIVYAAKCLLLAKVCYSCTNYIFKRLIEAIFLKVEYSRLSTFVNIGSLLSRISKDQCMIDENLPEILNEYSQCLASAIGRFVILAWFIPMSLLLLLVYGIFSLTVMFFATIRYLFVQQSTRIKQRENRCREEILSFVKGTICSSTGMASIRIMRVSGYVESKFLALQDDFQSATMSFVSLSIGVTLIIELFCLIYLLLVFFAKDRTLADKIVLVKLAIEASLFLQWTLQCSIQWEEFRNAFARLGLVLSIAESEKISDDAFSNNESGDDNRSEKNQMNREQTCNSVQSISMDERASPNSTGIVAEQNSNPIWLQIENLSFRYSADSPLIFSELSLAIGRNSLVLLKGRTGSGKSTLFSILLKMFPAANDSGNIFVLNQEFSTIANEEYRSLFSFVPQTPMLFKTISIRQNIDPIARLTDEELYQCLISVGINVHIQGCSIALESNPCQLTITDQHRLGMARALCRKSAKFFLIDECFDSFDPVTSDDLIRRLRHQLNDKVLIVITHTDRLDPYADTCYELSNGKFIQRQLIYGNRSTLAQG